MVVAVCDDGRLWLWGWGEHGNLGMCGGAPVLCAVCCSIVLLHVDAHCTGVGTTENHASPVEVKAPQADTGGHWTAVAAGGACVYGCEERPLSQASIVQEP